MAQNKHLHELLSEDQEPFLLQDYIADRRHQLKCSSPKNQIQLRRRRPISDPSPSPSSSSSTLSFCKSACFSFHESPDVTKSPLFRSPRKTPNPILLRIPPRTAAVLLEAAAKIQKTGTSSSSSKPKTRDPKSGFGFFGTVMKKLAHRRSGKKREIDGVRVSVKDIMRWDSSKKLVQAREGAVMGDFEKGFSSSCSCEGRLSSPAWSESNEERSLHMDTSSSSSDSMGSGPIERFNGVYGSSEKRFCESPFRFALQRSPSSGRRTPDLSSPAASPNRRKDEKKSYEEKSLNKFGDEEEEEDKEQCSPVSVLDPPFNDDEDAHEDSYDLECSFAIVQKTKHHLLQKLRRFERLAELDPIELEKLMEREECNEDDSINDDGGCDYIEESVSFDSRHCAGGFSGKFEWDSCSEYASPIPVDMKRLVSDLISEESSEFQGCSDDEELAKRVYKRLESWNEVEANTIDMMIEVDFRRELDVWKKNQDQVEDVAMEIERAIFGVLVKELTEEVPFFCS